MNLTYTTFSNNQHEKRILKKSELKKDTDLKNETFIIDFGLKHK